ncbi:DNA topoisomerase [Plesiomonas shigelloides]|nr:DNA topoisomerase [Plesiomonas shigelloides]
MSITCDAAKLQEKKTTPPKPFTEGTLLTAMCNIAKEVTDAALKAKLKETAGLGTEATRAGIIEILKERGYLTTKGKTLVSTDSGRMLIMGLPAVIRDPAITAIWEQQLDVVESGEYSVEKFMAVMEKTLLVISTT